jgi:glycosyltransferase involved in cell wall biosynthesis
VDYAKFDAVFINGFQKTSLTAARSAKKPVALRLAQSYEDTPPSELAEIKKFIFDCERILAASRYLKEVLIGWGVSMSRITVVPYAYDQIFAQQIALVTMRAARPAGFDLVTNAHVEPWNLSMHETVLAAIARLRLNCHLGVLGAGPSLDALKTRTHSLMIDGRVTFFENLRRPKKLEYLRAAKAFIEPVGRQGFPSLALHAMSMGCPVIATAEGSLPELIQNGENGLMYRQGDSADLAEQITTLATNPDLSLKLIDAGVATVERHNWAQTTAAALSAIESMEVRS